MHSVTLKEIYKFKPCKSGIDNLLDKLSLAGNNFELMKEMDVPVYYNFIIHNCPLDDVIWSLRCNQRGVAIAVKFARMCADHVTHLNTRSSRSAAEYAEADDAAYAAYAAAACAAEYAAAEYVAYAAYAAEREWQKETLLNICKEY